MSQPTASAVADLARSHLGDDAISGGEVGTSTLLLPFIAQATRELFRAMANIQLPRVRVTAFYNLPANTARLYPATASITDFDEPVSVEERAVGGSYAVSAASVTSYVPTLTTATHPLTTGSWGVVYGINGLVGASGEFVLTCADTTHATLNGAYVTGTYSSGGTLSYSTEEFVPLSWVDRIQEAEGDLNASLDEVAWEGGAYRFHPASVARQLRLVYWSSAPTVTSVNDTIGVDDCIDFLASRTAALFAASRGAVTIASILNQSACGPTGQPDASGGLLRQLLQNAVLREQAEQPIRRQPYRSRRSALPGIW